VNPNANRKPRDSKQQVHPVSRRVFKELLSWFWVLLAFVLLEGTVAQARMIPSGSMENTLLVGDHLIVSLAGYDAGVPFTNVHMPLWRQPHRQQIFVIRNVEPNSPDLIKRVIGIPGDRIKIVSGRVYLNGKPLDEPYSLHRPGAATSIAENFPPPASDYSMGGLATPQWTRELQKHIVGGEIVVPQGEYFMMGDNRDDSNDSRFWGFAPRANLVGTPLIIYMSIDAPEDAFESANPIDRFRTYLDAAVHPSKVRWGRLLHSF
jgi:signal peptidase I